MVKVRGESDTIHKLLIYIILFGYKLTMHRIANLFLMQIIQIIQLSKVESISLSRTALKIIHHCMPINLCWANVKFF